MNDANRNGRDMSGDNLSDGDLNQEDFDALIEAAHSMNIPERGPEYGAQVWARIEPRLSRRRWFDWARVPSLVWVPAVAAMLAVAFLAGRFSARPAHDPAAGQRVLLAAVSDCLDRSSMVLAEFANGGGQDLNAEKQRAEDLLSELRLYRQSASLSDDRALAGLLEEVEILLLDLAHESGDVGNRRPRLEEMILKLRAVRMNDTQGTNDRQGLKETQGTTL